MNLHDTPLPTDDLDACLRQTLRLTYGSQHPARSLRRQLLDRAAEQRRARSQPFSLMQSLVNWARTQSQGTDWPESPLWNHPLGLQTALNTYLNWLTFSQFIR